MTPARYVLDTSVLIDMSKRNVLSRERLSELLGEGNVLGTCAVATAEFLSGVPPADRRPWGRWLEAFAYWDISQSAAIQAGEWRYDFARRGIVLSLGDALIAAVARDVGAILVTNNLKVFPMAGIETMSLR